MSGGPSAAGGRSATAGYVGLLAVCTVVSLGWLAVGMVVTVAGYWPGVLDSLRTAAAGGSTWARGVVEAAPRSEPLDQAVLDHGFSALNLVIAAVLLRHARRSWSLRLLVIAMVGSAGAFNLQAHAAAVAVEIATGWSVGHVHQVVLHGVASTAYILALLVFPTVSWTARHWRGPAGNLLITVGVGTLLLVGFGTALLPHTTSCILFFGFLVPIAGLVVLPARVRRGATSEQRTQARLLLSVLVAAFATAAVLAVVTLVLAGLGQSGLTLYDPTAHAVAGGERPTALLFWFSRLASAAIATAVLVATVGARPGTTEQLFGRGLAATLVAALAGGAYAVVRAALGDRWGVPGVGAPATAVLAAVPVALVFLPLYLRVENLVDRLLYGPRPTPYSVLAGVAALSHTTATDAPDLARVAEAVAHGLGATTCRLTVRRPGLRDRTYSWTDGDTDAGDLVTVPISQGDDELGEIAVDRAAVAGLHAQRRHLLEDIADSLRVVLQASRSGIELERQLRAAVAHGEAIAVARRAAVAEMDSERRRIERDLHDGAQHHLVTLGLTLGLVEHQVGTGQIHEARERLDQLMVQVDVAEAVLAETATGVSSAALSERGLAAALSAALSGALPPVTVECDGVPASRRFPAEIGDTAYFCCLEAVNNARKHAPGVPVTVSIAELDGTLRMAVCDTGPGFTPEPVPGTGAPAAAGRGLRNVTARITAVGGTIAIRSAPGAGTTVEWSLPLPGEGEGEGADAAGTGGGDARGAEDGTPLLRRMRDLVRHAAEVYAGTDRSGDLAEIATRLDAPGCAAGEGRSDVLEVRAALTALEAVVRSSPLDGDRTHRLRYELERLRSGAHELAEIRLADTLRAGDVALPEEARRSAERLLGLRGADPRVRLGLDAEADEHEIRVAAAAELARWQRWATHPASTGGVRDAAQVVVRTCEHLLAEAGPG